jgi:DNA primase
MARIADAEIERLKKEIPIERLVTGFGVELKRQGKDLFGRCPFHEDKTPSLSVTRKQTYGIAWVRVTAAVM